MCNVQPSLSSPIVVSSTKPLYNTFLGMVELTDSRKDVDLYFSIHVYSIFTLWLPVQCSDISIRLVLHYLDIFNRTSPTQTVCVVNLVFGRWRLYFTSSEDRSLFYWKLFYIFWRQIFVLQTLFYIFERHIFVLLKVISDWDWSVECEVILSTWQAGLQYIILSQVANWQIGSLG